MTQSVFFCLSVVDSCYRTSNLLPTSLCPSIPRRWSSSGHHPPLIHREAIVTHDTHRRQGRAERKTTSEKKKKHKILRRGTLDMREPSDQASLARLQDEQVGLLCLDKKLQVYGCCCASTCQSTWQIWFNACLLCRRRRKYHRPRHFPAFPFVLWHADSIMPISLPPPPAESKTWYVRTLAQVHKTDDKSAGGTLAVIYKTITTTRRERLPQARRLTNTTKPRSQSITNGATTIRGTPRPA